MTQTSTASTHELPEFQVGDRVVADNCGRADNVQFIRHNVEGAVTKLMGAALAFRGDDGSLYFAMIRNNVKAV